MKISLLHLSDLHFKTHHNSIFEKIENIFDAIKNEIDSSKYLFLIFTGDIAYSGQKEEYEQAKIFIESLIEKLQAYNKNLHYKCIFTPGNHDCDFSGNQEIRNLVIDNILKDPSGISKTIIDTCIVVQKEYIDFVNQFNSAGDINYKVSNNLFKRYEYNNEHIKIAFNSYNLSWISRRNENQSEILFPVNTVDNAILANEDFDLTVSLFHHPMHWLKHQNLRLFRDLIQGSSNIVLTGHEHTHSAHNVSALDSEQKIQYIEAAALQDSHDIENSAFNLINIDLSSRTQELIEFCWKQDLYHRKSIPAAELPFHKKPMFRFKDVYKKRINTLGLKVTHPSKDDITLEEIFVYPDLLCIDNTDGNRNNFIEMTSEQLKKISSVGHTIIYGAETSGKTSLINMLQMGYKHNGLIPIVLAGKEIKSNEYSVDRIKKVIHASFKNKYEIDDKTLTLFEQIDKKDVVIIIDDFNESPLNSEYKAAFIQNLATLDYPNIFIFAHESMSFEATSEGALAKELVGYKHYKILEFGHRLRDKLIRKWVLLGNESSLEHSDLIYIVREKANTISKTVGYNIVPSFPVYLLTLLQSMEINDTSSLTKSSYGHYYQYLIMQYLNQDSRMEPKNINTIFTYASTFAFNAFIEKKYEFTFDELKRFDKAYCEEKKFRPTFDIVDKLVKSHIISEYDGEYKFSHNYIYYFFVAQYFADNISNPHIQELVAKLCKRLYRTEFANILMFLLHHSPQSFILDMLLDEVKNIFSGISEFTFALDELVNINQSVKVEAIEYDNRSLEKSREMELDKQEKAHSLERYNHVDDRYEADYNEDLKPLDMFATLNLAIKMMDLLGEIIKNYSGSLDGKIKYDLILECYGVGLRSLKSIIALFEENHELLREAIQEVITKKQYVTEDKISETVSSMIFGMASSISTGIIKRIAKAVASKDLSDIYKEILDEDPKNIAKQLISYAIELDFPNGLNVRKIEATHEILARDNNRLTDSTLKKLVLEHMYMFDVDISKKQSLCAKLEINNENSKKEMMKQLSHK